MRRRSGKRRPEANAFVYNDRTEFSLMKPTIIRALPLMAALLFPASFAAESSTSTPPAATPQGERVPPERFELKVLKVYEAIDGEAKFRAYVVRWKDQEVVVSDNLVRTDYKEGDTIPVLAMNHPFPQGREPHRLLAFTVIPNPR
jgi:hypothetical protein